MNSKARRIFVVCAIGTMVGLFVAVNLPSLIWWLGALVGGLISGFLYALPDIVRYTPRAARSTWRTLTYLPEAVSLLHGRVRDLPSVTKWQIASVVIFGVYMVFWVWASLELLVGKPSISLLGALHLLILEVVMLGSVFSPEVEDREKIRWARKVVILATPPGPLILVIWILIAVVKAVPEIVMVISECARFLGGFAKTLFLFIHSRELVLCFVDGCFGVAISYFIFVVIGNMQLGPTLLAGGLTGGLVGVVNYEVVSRRLLRLESVVDRL